MQVIQATAMPARKFAENATIRQELAQMDILQDIAASAPAEKQEATAGIIILTAILGKLCAVNVKGKPVLMGILVLILVISRLLVIKVWDVQAIVGIIFTEVYLN